MKVHPSRDVVLKRGKAVVSMVRQFISPGEVDCLLSEFQQGFCWKREGSRLSSFFSEKSYSYGSIVHNPCPIPDFLLTLMQKVMSYTGHEFNSVYFILYQSGGSRLSWHADDEQELGRNPTIGSISIGASRVMGFKPKTELLTPIRCTLHAGDLLVMAGSVQHDWLHCVFQENGYVQPGINITFRHIIS